MLQNKKTLVIGATPKTERYGYMASEMLHKKGHDVVPYSIKKGNIGSLNIRNQWPTDTDFHTITLYINKQLQTQYIDRILALKPHRIIFNPGTENIELFQLAEHKNITPINACTLVLLQTNQF